MTSVLSHYLCVGCPLGCRLEVVEEDGAIVEVRGFSCKRGREYGEREHVDPRRMVSSTVAISGAAYTRLPVRTSCPVPKHQVLPICRALRRVTVTAPLGLGAIVVRNILDTGADIIATRDLPGAGLAALNLDGAPAVAVVYSSAK